jgi:hypothetical protein
MNVQRLLGKVVAKFRLYSRNQHWRVLLRDRLHGSESVGSDRTHLEAAIAWLLLAQQRSGSRGVALSYSLTLGWRPAYPETTGYIINTLIDFGKFTGEGTWLAKAIEMGEWECDIQLPSGAVRIQTPEGTVADVFDTGMVLLGFCQLYAETKQEKFLAAAKRAGDWLVSVQSANGAWEKSSYKDIPHVYHSKVAWALMELHAISGEASYLMAVKRNLTWIFSVRRPNGWYDFMAFTERETPFTHTIAYTLQGFWGISKLMPVGDEWHGRLLDECRAMSDRLIAQFNLTQPSRDMLILPGELTERWEGAADYACLTGNAQFSIVWLELFALSKERRYYAAATQLLEVVKRTHRTRGPDLPFRNAVAGSYPISGRYHSYEFPNWAAKFFADALLRKIQIDSRTAEISGALSART